MPSNDYCSFERSKERKLALDEMSNPTGLHDQIMPGNHTASR